MFYLKTYFRELTFCLAAIVFIAPIAMVTEASNKASHLSTHNPQFSVTDGGKKIIAVIKKNSYVDLLIDPTIEEDIIEKSSSQSSSSLFNIHHNIEFLTNYDLSMPEDQQSYAAGLGYRGYMPTDNYGQFVLNLVSLYEPQHGSYQGLESSSEFALSRYSLEQYQFPLTESIMIDNKIGTHRMSSHHLRSTHFISRRFTTNEPDVLGVTTQLYRDNTSLLLSWGMLGNSSGQTLQGFAIESGEVLRAQVRQSFDKVLLSFDIWKTLAREEKSANRLGYRTTLDAILTETIRSSMTIAYSAENAAFLLGFEQNSGRFTQNIGGYYYDRNFLWIDREISSDNTGVYYRFNHSHKAFNYGGSFEWQRRGFDSDNTPKNDTFFISSQVGYRINRQSRLNMNYNYRVLNNLDKNTVDSSLTQHSIQSSLNYRHTRNLSSSLQLGYRYTQYQLNHQIDTHFIADYGINYALPNGSNVDASLEYTRNYNSSSQTDSLNMSLGWQQDLFNDQQLGLNGTYRIITTQKNTNNGSLSLNHQWYITDQLSTSFNINYNHSLFEIKDNTFNQLVTDIGFDSREFNQQENSQLSASFNVNYQFGSGNDSLILSAKAGRIGSGVVRGRVFIDKNQDGIFQANEKGLPNVEVFLNSLYPMKTNAQGEFIFKSVGVGEHYLFIDETQLPLPWFVKGKENWTVNSELRSTSMINIPVSKIGLD